MAPPARAAALKAEAKSPKPSVGSAVLGQARKAALAMESSPSAIPLPPGVPDSGAKPLFKFPGHEKDPFARTHPALSGDTYDATENVPPLILFGKGAQKAMRGGKIVTPRSQFGQPAYDPKNALTA